MGTASFLPPFKASSALVDEARFVHIVKGQTRLCSPQHQISLKSGDSMIMKCENFVNSWLPNEDGERSKVIVIQLYPQVLKDLYNEQLPELFTKTAVTEHHAVEPVEANDMPPLRYRMIS